MSDSSTTDKSVNRLGAKGTMRGSLYDPHFLFVIGLDGGVLGLDKAEEERIAGLIEYDRPAALAPFKEAWLRDQFSGDAHALAMVDALLDDRATQHLDPGFVASCSSGVTEPIIATHLGSFKDGSPCVAVVEGRQRVRSLRITNVDRAAEDPTLPPYALATVMRAFTSPRKAREIKIVTANHVQLSPLQRARRAQELIDDGIAPSDAAPLVGCASAKALKDLMSILKRDASVQDAVASGAVSGATAKELKHLSAGEQRERAELIVNTGAKGRKAVEIARTGKASSDTLHAPTRSVVEGVTKRLLASADPLLRAIGAGLQWSTTGAEPAAELVPGLHALINEEIGRYHGMPLTADERSRLQLKAEQSGGVEAFAASVSVNLLTFTRALSGLRVKSRVRSALLKAINGETKPT